MKHSERFFLFITLDIFLLFLSSCGIPAARTEIKMVNSSSYDLIVDFEIDEREFLPTELKKNHSNIFPIFYENTYKFTNPNEVMSRIVLSNLDNGEIIKELINDTNGSKILFIFDKEWIKGPPKIGSIPILDALFLLEITDALLGFTNE